MRAIERLREKYITEEELAELLNVDIKRLRDLRSHHLRGKSEFINHIKPSGKCVLYAYMDVVKWLKETNVCSFGMSQDESCDLEVSD